MCVYMHGLLVVWKNWRPLDTDVGAWLLDPDHTPNSFSELLARYGMQQMAPPTSAGGTGEDWTLQALRLDLSLLGPLLVKIYHQLQAKQLLEIFLEIESKLIPILAGTHTHPISCYDDINNHAPQL